MSRTGTNLVRVAVAAMLGLAACLVAWWPQSAAGSGDAVVVSSPAAALPTQKTPSAPNPPTATVAPTNPAPPPAPPPSTPKPTKKPTKKPTHHNPPTLHNNGGNNSGGSNNAGSNNHNSGGSNNNPPATHSGTVSTSVPYVPPPAAPSTPVARPTKPAPSTPTAAPTTEAPTPEAQATTDDPSNVDDAETYDTYLTSSEPVATKSAPVWVVPGILLVLTSMLALLGGVLGRGTRPALTPVKVSNENDEPTGS